MSYEDLHEAARAIATATGRVRHEAAVVLGSGLSDYATSLDGAVEVPYDQIPHFPAPRVEGHAGSLFSVEVDGRAVLLFAGRVHTYEGWDLSDVVFGARTAAASGCHTVVLTNAAGGIREGLEPGSLVAIRDHINMTGPQPAGRRQRRSPGHPVPRPVGCLRHHCEVIDQGCGRCRRCAVQRGCLCVASRTELRDSCRNPAAQAGRGGPGWDVDGA